MAEVKHDIKQTKPTLSSIKARIECFTGMLCLIVGGELVWSVVILGQWVG